MPVVAGVAGTGTQGGSVQSGQGVSQVAVDILRQALANQLKVPSADVERLHSVLWSRPYNANAVPMDLALEVIRQRQLRDTFELSDVVSFAFYHWAKDQRIVAFYRDALATRGEAAVADLATNSTGPWDASFIEPVTRVAETGSDYIAVSRAMELLDRRYQSWVADPSIATRLGQAVLKRRATHEAEDWMYQWFELAAKTHDLSLIAAVRPYLDNGRIDTFTSMSANMPSGVTPMRYSELAANTICVLLGERIMFDPWKRAKAPKGGPYPEWREWDVKIAALKERLRRLIVSS